jgi:hypothetical protein
MPQHRSRPLLEALLAGLPLAVLTAPVLYLAGVPFYFLIRGVFLAFTVGFAFELLSSRLTWARTSGGVITILLLAASVAVWSDWARFVQGQQHPQTDGVQATGSIPAAGRGPGATGPGTVRTGADGGPGGIRAVSEPRPTDGGRATGEPAGPGGAGPTRATAPATTAPTEPGAPPPGPPATLAPAAPAPTTPAPGVPASLTLHNTLDGVVHVRLQGPGADRRVVRIESGARAEIRLGRADPDRARVTWQHRDVEYWVSWRAAIAGGGVFVIRLD